MFDVWHGDINFTTLILIVSVMIVLPVQLLLCFTVRNRAIRLLPVIMLSAFIGIFVIMAVSIHDAIMNSGRIWTTQTMNPFYICDLMVEMNCGIPIDEIHKFHDPGKRYSISPARLDNQIMNKIFKYGHHSPSFCASRSVGIVS